MECLSTFPWKGSFLGHPAHVIHTCMYVYIVFYMVWDTLYIVSTHICIYYILHGLGHPVHDIHTCMYILYSTWFSTPCPLYPHMYVYIVFYMVWDTLYMLSTHVCIYCILHGLGHPVHDIHTCMYTYYIYCILHGLNINWHKVMA